MQEILQLYPTLHEASEEKFVERVNRLICNKHLPTRLQKRRKDAQLTQKELAGRSGVKLRTIQQYEMRAKNINKAAAETLQQLAQVLLCNMEDLIEYDCWKTKSDWEREYIMADMKFHCPHCEQTLIIDEQYAGQICECPDCKRELCIPLPKNKSIVLSCQINTWQEILDVC